MESKAKAGSLQDKFEGFGAQPSDALWGNIAASLDEKKKRRGFIWWWTGGAMAAAIAALVVMNYNVSENNPANSEINTVAETDFNTENDQETSTDSFENEDGSIIEEQEFFANIPDDEVELIENEDEQDSNFESSDDSQLYSFRDTDIVQGNEQQNELEPLMMQEPDLAIAPEQLGAPRIPFISSGLRIPELKENMITFPNKSYRPWEFGLAYSAWKGVELNFKKELVDTDNYDLTPPPPPDTTAGTTQVEELSYVGVNTPSKVIRKNINFHLFAGKYFADRWAWRTGLDFAQTVYSNQYDANLQFLNYDTRVTSFGIPLSLRLDMIKRPVFQWRASLGVVNEFHMREKIQSGDYALSYYSQKSAAGGYSGALEIGLSHEFKLKGNLHLFAAPSYRWYFAQNVTKLNASIAEHNHWLGGVVGVKWNL